MTPEQFTAWRERMGWSKVETAKQLGVSIASVALYERGTRFEDDRPVEIPKTIILATEALTYRKYA
jgi:transcriptional regulator with XRE-family HTH domain